MGLLILMGMAVLCYFGFRQSILIEGVQRIEEKFARDFGGELGIAKAGFSDWRSVRLEEISLQSPAKDTLFTLSALEIKLRVWPLFTGNILPASVKMFHGSLDIAYCDSLDNNIDWLNRPRSDFHTSAKAEPRSLSDRMASLIDAAFRWMPDQVEMEDIALRIQYEQNDYAFIADSVRFEGGEIYSVLTSLSPRLEQKGVLSGVVNRKKRSFDLLIEGGNKAWLTVPFIWEEFEFWTAVADVRLSVSNIHSRDGVLVLHTEMETDRLFLAHPKLSDSTVNFPYIGFKGDWRIGVGDITLDSTSTFSVDRVMGNVGGAITFRPGKSISTMLTIKAADAQDFFHSLPGGMFHNLKGIQVAGKLDYRFDIFIDQDSLELSYLNSRLTSDQFRIVQFGETDLRRMNNNFYHEVFEENNLVASFLVGPENPDFVPYDSISTLLKHAILTCEDPSFFTHKGFLESAISESMVQNLKARRFARGGSTISMQLVKNVFLNREKFVARKLEEILLVWLLEGQSVTSKQRMFEVYVNLIEWGPNVYGIGSASNFYFGKNQTELSLAESIYLASIVPRPKKFRWYFEGDSLRHEWSDFNQNIARRMLDRGLIESLDSTTFSGQVSLIGPAGGFLMVRDTLDADTLDITPDDLLRGEE